MKQVVQAVSGGPVQVLDVPAPVVGPTEVLVRTVASIVSPGTERAVTASARSSLLAKASNRPDLVRQVVAKARTEGVGSTARAVRARLGGDVPLGYSGCGLVVEVGAAVEGIRPGQLVATGGAGRANHAELQAVPGLLCTVVPDGVPAGDAAFATIASIALHGLRLADVGPGSKVVVVGLGLVGQLAARLAAASGCDVAGIDLAELPLRTAEQAGVLALLEEGEPTTARILDWTRGRGADAVLLCASSGSSEIVGRVPPICRDRAQVVVVGDVGLELERTPFYEKELSLRFARSYGPGRYERGYEDWGVDYPAGQVRWTEGRNAEAVLDLLATGRLLVDDLVTHVFPLEAATAAYELVESGREPYLAIRFRYRDPVERARAVPLSPLSRAGGPGIGWIGAGGFSASVLLPAFRAAGLDRLVAVASATGLSARRFGERNGFARAVPGAEAVLADPDVDVVVVATPHDTHADLVVRALAAGKSVWCEKPLALTVDELDAVSRAAGAGPGVLAVGFNRRHSPAVRAVGGYLAGRTAPLSLVYRVAAGPVPAGHRYGDRIQGGRLLGEVCHFVDTCCALNPSEVVSVRAVAGGHGEPALADDLAVLLAHADGSVSTVAYSSADPPGTGKELVEGLAGDRRAVVDDFRTATVGGHQAWHGHQDKGHAAAVAAFAGRLRSGAEDPTALVSTRLTLLAAASLGSLSDPWPDEPVPGSATGAAAGRSGVRA